MTTETKARIGFGVGGLLLGGLLLYGISSLFNLAEDEDRPPIIVRGGSLEFKNGTTARPGRAWKTGSVGFQMDHEPGKPVGQFQLYFIGGSGQCEPQAVRDFTISFDHDGLDNTPARLYEVRIRPDQGRPAPTVSGEGLSVNPNDTTQLEVRSSSRMFTVIGSSFQCTNPTEVWIESLR